LKLKNKRREQAAQLLAEDRHNDVKITELCVFGGHHGQGAPAAAGAAPEPVVIEV